MPGSVANAVPVGVLPWSLCKTFVHSREYIVQVNEYKNGESQRGLVTETSRKSWKTARRLTPARLEDFRTFFGDKKGALKAFYFYDHTETSPKFSYDPTGAAVIGRYTVRLDSPWSQIINVARAEAPIEITELA